MVCWSVVGTASLLVSLHVVAARHRQLICHGSGRVWRPPSLLSRPGGNDESDSHYDHGNAVATGISPLWPEGCGRQNAGNPAARRVESGADFSSDPSRWRGTAMFAESAGDVGGNALLLAICVLLLLLGAWNVWLLRRLRQARSLEEELRAVVGQRLGDRLDPHDPAFVTALDE